MRNPSITDPVTWQEDVDGYLLTFNELIRQAYSNCVFSAGEVEGHPVDTLYLKLEKDGVRDTLLLIRPDEAAALAWCLTGALWSVALDKLPEETPDGLQQRDDHPGDTSLWALLDFGLGSRAFNSLMRRPGMQSIEQLCKIMAESPEELLALRNFGMASLNEVRKALTKYLAAQTPIDTLNE